MVDENGNFGLLTSVLIGAIIGLACSYIPDVVLNLKDGFDWADFNTFEDNCGKYVGATLGGAIGGLGTGIGTTMLFGGVGNVVSGAFNGEVNSFCDGMLQFAFGALTSGISYGISKGISTKLASSKISKIIGTSGKNSKINANLAKNKFGDMKVGNAGMKNITKELYRKLGFENMQDGISYVLDFGMGVIFSI